MSKPKLSYKVREDLKARHGLDQDDHWVVKDPISMQYFHLKAKEWFVFQRLDGRHSVSQIQRRFHQRFPDSRISLREIEAFIHNLQWNGLLQMDRPGQGKVWFMRAQKSVKRSIVELLLSPLALRLPSFNAERLLHRMTFLFGWIFHPVSAVLAGILFCCALVMILNRSDDLLRQLPNLDQVLNTPKLVAFIVVLSFVKLLHECGHGIACRRFGAECRKIGVIFLVFSPTLYCDVSDSWMIPDRRRRIVIALAGIYVELILAAVCAILWCYSKPNDVSQLLLQTMIICSVSSIFFNGNPLLRYDGYFVLSDLLNFPNLYEKSRVALHGIIFGYENDTGHSRGVNVLLLIYGLMSIAYRILIMTLIVVAIHRTLFPSSFRIVGRLFLVSIFLGLGWSTFMTLKASMLKNNWRRRLIPLATRLMAFVSLCALILWVPYTRSVRVPVAVRHANATDIYAPISGDLVHYKKIGEQVAQGELIAELQDTDRTLEILRLDGELQVKLQQLQALQQRKHFEPELATLIATSESIAKSLRKQINALKRDADLAKLRAPEHGVLLPVGHTKDSRFSTLELPALATEVLDECNQHRFVEQGELLCIHATPGTSEAIACLYQEEVDFIEMGDPVSLMFEHSGTRRFRGVVEEVSWRDDEFEPNDYPSKDARSAATPKRYLVRISVQNLAPGILHGSGGIAKFRVERISLATRLYRFANSNFDL